MKYKCLKCGFIHSGELFDGYYCPLCHSSIFDFELISNEEKIYNRVEINKDNNCIYRIEEKCINCGACFKTCENIVGIKQDVNKVCIGCGQCILTCPKAAIVPKYDYLKVLDYINDKTKKVIAVTSPAVRVGIGDAFDLEPGAFLEKKLVGLLKQLGFDYVFDTTFGADLTSMEESTELLKRIKEGKKLPMFSSCCPSWVKYAEVYHPELRNNISSCKSPIAMISSLIKNYYLQEDNIKKEDAIVVAITPCTSKKEEIVGTDTDFVLTTSELCNMIRECGISFDKTKEEEFDSLTGSSSGSIYGFSGGVGLAVLRCIYHFETGKDLLNNDVLIKEYDYYKEYRLKINKRVFKCAIVNTMPNLEKLLKGDLDYDFVEVMNCNGGCINGGGQIIVPINQKEEYLNKRKKSLSKNDNNKKGMYPYNNTVVKDIYEDLLDYPGSNKAIKLLHI